MSKKITIALDAMGGDYGPEVVIPAAIAALNELDFLHLILVGDQDRIQPVLDAQRSGITERIRIQHASQQVEIH